LARTGTPARTVRVAGTLTVARVADARRNFRRDQVGFRGPTQSTDSEDI
jgi:hypothetical protein